MAYLVPSEFVTKMVDAGESKILMSTRDTVIRAYMAGAILALAAVFAVTVTVPSATLSVNPNTASTPAAANVANISATVGHDPTNKGVDWTLSCPTPPCGTISANTSASGS